MKVEPAQQMGKKKQQIERAIEAVVEGRGGDEKAVSRKCNMVFDLRTVRGRLSSFWPLSRLPSSVFCKHPRERARPWSLAFSSFHRSLAASDRSHPPPFACADGARRRDRQTSPRLAFCMELVLSLTGMKLAARGWMDDAVRRRLTAMLVFVALQHKNAIRPLLSPPGRSFRFLALSDRVPSFASSWAPLSPCSHPPIASPTWTF